MVDTKKGRNTFGKCPHSASGRVEEIETAYFWTNSGFISRRRNGMYIKEELHQFVYTVFGQVN